MGILLSIPLIAGAGAGATTATVALSGAAIVGGIVAIKGHTKNKNRGNRDKHEAGDARRARDQQRARDRNPWSTTTPPGHPFVSIIQ